MPGDSQPCRCSPICTTSSALKSAKPTSVRCGGKIVRCNVLGARATTLASGAHINIDPGANAIGVIAASAPSTTSPIYFVAPEHATAIILDSRDLPVVSRLFVPAHCQRSGYPYPDQLPLVLVAAQCRLVL